MSMWLIELLEVKDTHSLSLSLCMCLSNHNVSGGLVGTLGVNLTDEFGGS